MSLRSEICAVSLECRSLTINWDWCPQGAVVTISGGNINWNKMPLWIHVGGCYQQEQKASRKHLIGANPSSHRCLVSFRCPSLAQLPRRPAGKAEIRVACLSYKDDFRKMNLKLREHGIVWPFCQYSTLIKWENSLKNTTIRAHAKRIGNLNGLLCTEEIKFVT